MRYDFLLSDSCFKAVAEGPSNLFKYLAGARGGRRTGGRFLVEGIRETDSNRRQKPGRARASKPERRVSTDEKSSRFFGS